MRMIKFRVWNMTNKCFYTEEHVRANLFNFLERTQEPVMQFTGLLDKSGKEIYEGDLILRDSRDKNDLDKVEYQESGFFPFAFYEFGDEGYDAKSCEIIGNIYENPSILV